MWHCRNPETCVLDCLRPKHFLKKVSDLIYICKNVKIDLSFKDLIIGNSDVDDCINHVIVIAMFSIYKSWLIGQNKNMHIFKQFYSFSLFKEELICSKKIENEINSVIARQKWEGFLTIMS